jgi:hypothetical protein
MYNTQNHANRTYTQQINTWRSPDTAQHAAATQLYRPWRHVVITIKHYCQE